MQINLSTQRVIDHTTFVVKNDGKSSAESFTYCLATSTFDRVAVLDVAQGSTEDGKKKLRPIADVTQDIKGSTKTSVTCGEYALQDPIPKGSSTEITVGGVYTGMLVPRPATMVQGDPHRVVFSGHAHIISPYKIASESVRVTVGGVISHNAPSPADVSDDAIALGPYHNVAAYTVIPFEVHYESDFPLIHATHVTRKITVSHWSGVGIDETYEVLNVGAKLVGEWSRLEAMTDEAASRGGISHMPALIPETAHDIYFRDDIGNISSSRVIPKNGQTAVMLEPRFPLFGGWRTIFKFGYFLPIAGSIHSEGGSNRFVLTTSLAPAVKELVVDELEVRIVLPEGASEVKVVAALQFERKDEREYTYLDVLGRPVLVLRLRNVVPEASSLVHISYTYAGWMMLEKVVIGGAGEFLIFCLFCWMFQMDNSLNHPQRALSALLTEERERERERDIRGV